MNANRSSYVLSVSRAGFTLFEMLVSALLSSMLILGMWSLFGTYMRLFESGQAKAEQSQLLRGLGEQIGKDLAAALQPSGIADVRLDANRAASSSPTASATVAIPAVGGTLSGLGKADSSLPVAGLIGTTHALRLDVLQTSADPNSLPKAAPVEPAGREPEPPAAPELRSVIYTFEEAREVRAADRRPPPGLVRRERDWQALGAQAPQGGSRDSAAAEPVEREIAASFETFDLLNAEGFAEQVDETTIFMPEVVALRFRYFDGRNWAEAWDSRRQASLPAAVEIVMHVRDTTRRKRADVPAPEAGQPPIVAEPAPVTTTEGDSFAEPPDDPNLLIYRDVVLLPHAARRGAAPVPPGGRPLGVERNVAAGSGAAP